MRDFDHRTIEHSSESLIIDELLVFSQSVLYDQGPPPAVTATWKDLHDLHATPHHRRYEGTVVFTLADGSVLHEGVFTCEAPGVAMVP